MEREIREVVEMLLNGLGNREIAVTSILASSKRREP